LKLYSSAIQVEQVSGAHELIGLSTASVAQEKHHRLKTRIWSKPSCGATEMSLAQLLYTSSWKGFAGSSASSSLLTRDTCKKMKNGLLKKPAFKKLTKLVEFKALTSFLQQEATRKGECLPVKLRAVMSQKPEGIHYHLGASLSMPYAARQCICRVCEAE
jgi:hypothetical protein